MIECKRMNLPINEVVIAFNNIQLAETEAKKSKTESVESEKKLKSKITAEAAVEAKESEKLKTESGESKKKKKSKRTAEATVLAETEVKKSKESKTESGESGESKKKKKSKTAAEETETEVEVKSKKSTDDLEEPGNEESKKSKTAADTDDALEMEFYGFNNSITSFFVPNKNSTALKSIKIKDVTATPKTSNLGKGAAGKKEPKMVDCRFCGKSYHYLAVNNHISKNHQAFLTPTRFPHECSVCGKRYRKRTIWKRTKEIVKLSWSRRAKQTRKGSNLISPWILKILTTTSSK